MPHFLPPFLFNQIKDNRSFLFPFPLFPKSNIALKLQVQLLFVMYGPKNYVEQVFPL